MKIDLSQVKKAYESLLGTNMFYEQKFDIGNCYEIRLSIGWKGALAKVDLTFNSELIAVFYASIRRIYNVDPWSELKNDVYSHILKGILKN